MSLVTLIEQTSESSTVLMKQRSGDFSTSLLKQDPALVDARTADRLYIVCLRFASIQDSNLLTALSRFGVALFRHLIETGAESGAVSKSVQKKIADWILTVSEQPPSDPLGFIERAQLIVFYELLLTPGLRIDHFPVLRECLLAKFSQVVNARIATLSGLSHNERLLNRTHCVARRVPARPAPRQDGPPEPGNEEEGA